MSIHDLFTDSHSPAPVLDSYGSDIEQQGTGTTSLAFYSFILLLAIVILRPGDWSPAVATLPFYFVPWLICIFLLFPRLIDRFRRADLAQNPISICTLGILGVILLDGVIFGPIRDVLTEIMHLGSFYFLLVAAVDSPKRLREVLLWLVIFILITISLGMMQYHGWINVNAAPYVEGQDYNDPDTGLPVYLTRLTSVGMYNNPNDLSRIVIVGFMLCLYCLEEKNWGSFRFLWIVPAFFCGVAMHLTYSRGGLIGLVAGVAVVVFLRLSFYKRLVLLALALPALFVLFSGQRMSDMDTEQGTGKERIELWRDAFNLMKSSPIVGIGMGNFGDQEGLIAHNSFVQSYVEMGLLGGSFYAGAFFLASWGVYRLKPIREGKNAEILRRIQPYLIGIVVGSIVGMFTSTRNYREDTYMLLAMSAVYCVLAGPLSDVRLKMDRAMVIRLAGVGLATLLLFNIYVRYSPR